MIIECNEIQQEINYLLIAFQDCNKIKNSDLRKLVNLVSGNYIFTPTTDYGAICDLDVISSDNIMSTAVGASASVT